MPCACGLRVVSVVRDVKENRGERMAVRPPEGERISRGHCFFAVYLRSRSMDHAKE